MIGSCVYSLLILCLAISLLPFLNSPNLEKNIPTLLVSASAMLGGVLAIIFSFGTLLIQNAANSSSIGFYNVIGRDRSQDVIYWAVALTVVFSVALAIVIGHGDLRGDYAFILSAATSFAFFLIGISFLLLYILFQRIYRRVNPFTNIEIIQREALKHIQKLSKTAKEIADLSLKQPDLPADHDPNQALAASYQFVRPQIAAIGIRLDYLFDFHDKLVLNKEQEFAKSVLNVAYNILVKYLRQRSNSSIVIPDREVFFVGVSDSQSFLAPQLERFVNTGKVYIRENNDIGVTHIIKLLRDLTLVSADIKYVVNGRQDNPIFSQCRGNLDQLAQFALGQKAFEASFQCANAYNQIGVVACQKQMELEVRSIIDLISTLCISSLLANQDVVWGRGMDVFTTLFKGVIRHASRDLKIQMEHLFDVSVRVVLLSDKSQSIKGSIVGINNQIKLDAFFATIAEEANLILKDMEDVEEKRDKAAHRLVSLAEAYTGFLGKLAEGMKTADSMLIQSIGDSIANFGSIQLYASTKTIQFEDQQKLLRQGAWFIYLPSRFVRHAKTINANTAFYALVDAPAKIGLYAVELGNEKLAKDAIDAISQMTLDMFEKQDEQSHGYTPPRMMEVACYVGVYALKERMITVVDHLKTQLDKFQEKYEKETISKLTGLGPNKEQIQRDLFRLREDLLEARHERLARSMIDRTSDRLLSKIKLEDLDRFIYRFWKTWDPSSPVADEFEKSDNGA